MHLKAILATAAALSGLAIAFALSPLAASAADPRACFFVDANNEGESVCVAKGSAEPSLAAPLNDAISSISIRGGASVTVCTEADFKGECVTFTETQTGLDGDYDNSISSYKVE